MILKLLLALFSLVFAVQTWKFTHKPNNTSAPPITHQTTPPYVPFKFSLGGSVSGLPDKQSLTLANADQTLKITQNGTFVFPQKIDQGGSFSVYVAGQPPGVQCQIADNLAQKTNVQADIRDLAVVCQPITFELAGRLSGLVNGQSVMLNNNGIETLSLTNNGEFKFTRAVPFGGTYSVSVLQHPKGFQCAINGQSVAAAPIVQAIAPIAVNCEKQFTVFHYLKARAVIDENGYQSSTSFVDNRWYADRHIQPVNLYYNLTTCDNITPQICDPNFAEIAKVAEAADPTGTIPSIMDLEVWDRYRFNPTQKTPNSKSIVENLSESLVAFRQRKPGVLLGMYSGVPQNTYGRIGAADLEGFQKLDQQYQAVADLVDYFAPSLYNYNYDGTSQGDEKWRTAAEFSIKESNMLGPNKPVYPFINPFWDKPTDNNQKIKVELTYEQMKFRLQTLKDLGANGCVLWMSSGMRDLKDPSKPYAIDSTQGWFKAVMDMASKK